jgi:hypothetical protein
MEEEYILWKEREGRVPKGAGEEVEQEEEETWGKRMKEAEEQRAIIREHLGEPLSTERREEIINMSIEDMEKELAESRLGPKPGDGSPVTMEELLAEIEDNTRKIDTNLKRRIQWKGRIIRRRTACLGGGGVTA